jgi:hypothetical protein
MTSASPHYIRVRPDTRRDIIPLLSADAHPIEDGDTHDRLATAVFMAYFAALLVGAMAAWLALAR